MFFEKVAAFKKKYYVNGMQCAKIHYYQKGRKKMSIEMKPLPYDLNALEPVISGRTMEFHYGKHYKAYVDKTNELIKGTQFENASLEEIITFVAGKPEYQTLFNNAGQAWNHEFFWHSLTPNAQERQIEQELADKIKESFGSLDAFKEAFAKAAVAQFGSGWAWLVYDGDVLKIMTTSNANMPFKTDTLKPLLCLDVWEHAYYLDYQNRRPDFAKEVLDKILNWKFAFENYKN